MPIEVLSKETVSKIAAGEVIDRPASIVKELIENALDSEATCIKVIFKDNALSVIDNGIGMSKSDLLKSPLQYSTSKVKNIDDIYAVATFGFRGEALFSIAHVASLAISSKHHKHDTAYSIVVHEGIIETCTPCMLAEGSVVEVSALFETFPVRKKFLKSHAKELGLVYALMIHFSLTYPHKKWILHYHNDCLLNTSGLHTLRNVIWKVWGKSYAEHCCMVDHVIKGIAIQGCISTPKMLLPNRKKQLFSVNKRMLTHPFLSRGIQGAYATHIPKGKFPFCVLNFSLPPTELDVNVHPQKKEFHWIHQEQFFSILHQLIDVVLTTRAVSEIPQRVAHVSHRDERDSSRSTEGSTAQALPLEKECNASSLQESKPDTQEYAIAKITQKHSLEKDALAMVLPECLTPCDTDNSQDAETYWQLFQTYIAFKDNNGLVILDQHAVHERILYEKLISEWDAYTTGVMLLVSEVVSLSESHFKVYCEEQNVFQSLDIISEIFGKNKIIIRQMPTLFSNLNVQESITSLLDAIALDGTSHATASMTQHRTHALVAQISCKAAIKAGKCLSKKEIIALITSFKACPQQYTCPHGRPLFIQLGKKKLEKMFLRR